MELRPGYKQTDVGVIPEDWDAIPLRQTCRAIYRGASPRPIGDPRWFDHGSDIGWVRISDVTRSRRYLGETTQRLSEEGMKRSRFIPRGSLIMSICATVGRPIETAVNTCIHDGFVVFENPGVDQGFLYHVLCDLEPRWTTKGQTGSQMNLNTNLIKITSIPLPPNEEEQQAIATTLSDVDALLEGLDRLIAKKRDLKQAAMQQLLTGDTRLPGFSGTWKTIMLGQVGIFLKGKGIRRDDVSDEGLACIRYGELYTVYDDYITNPRSHIAHNIADTALPLEHGDLLFAGSGETAEEIGKCAAYLADEKGYAGGDIVVLRLSGQNTLYLGYLLNQCGVNGQKARLAQGDTVVHISPRHLAMVVVKLPPIDEQEAIAGVLSDMDTDIQAFKEQRAKIADVKQAMMQELLTGNTRLVEPQVSDKQRETASSKTTGHNWAFNEAVVIATLVKHFGRKDYPLGRKRYTKLSYLLHRRAEKHVEGYLKKVAGPYNPQTKYGGPEKIAKQNGYITQHKGPKGHSGFIAADNIAQAEGYFEKWYGPEVIPWLKQFRYKKNDDLEVLATVDMAAMELRVSGQTVDVAAVKDLISSHPEWEAKLDRAAFSDANIAKAINQSDALQGSEIARGSHA